MAAPSMSPLRKHSCSIEGASNWANEGSNSDVPSPYKKAKGKMANIGVLEVAVSPSRAH